VPYTTLEAATTFETTLPHYFVRATETHGDRDSLVFPGQRLTYASLGERARARALQLRSLGLAEGDRLGVLLANCPAYLEFLFGASLLGVIVVPINVRFKARELRHVITNAQLKALVSTERLDNNTVLADTIAESLPGLAANRDPFELMVPEAPELRAVVLLEGPESAGFASESALVARVAPDTDLERQTELSPDDTALVFYTSGTTANPKGCLLSHGAVTRNFHNFAAVFELTGDDRIWDPLPFFHLASLIPFGALMGVGGCYVSMTHFDADLATRMLHEEDVTVIYSLFPTITQDLLHHEHFEARRPRRARLICNIAPVEMQRQVQRAFAPARLVSAYGITEATGTVCYSMPGDSDELRATTCGRPFPGVEAAIIDLETGARLGPGQRGELLLRGYLIFKGYFRDEENTRRAIDGDGWLHTGDICTLDEDGNIVYLGRDKDMLKVGGENVAAIEIESLLAQHPAVKLAQVVGVPHPRLVEVPAAFVELAPGHEASEEELIEFCRGQIARFKVPHHVRFVTEWPMSATKIQKFRLRDQLTAELATADRT
jgi:acyl-CoA synthetase (AMP-forming)/AMP-acid ligase II